MNDFCSRKGGATIGKKFYPFPRVSAILEAQLKKRETRIMRKRNAKKHPYLEHTSGKHWGSKSPFTRMRRKANTQKRFDQHLAGVAKIEKLLRRAL